MIGWTRALAERVTHWPAGLKVVAFLALFAVVLWLSTFIAGPCGVLDRAAHYCGPK